MTRFLRLQRVLIVFLMLFVSACSVYQMPGQSPGPVRPPVPEEQQPDDTEVPSPHTPVETTPTDAEPEPGVSAAYSPLLARAETASARGDYEQALALLERAQRIDPDNARIYLDMARTHDARGNNQLASATAERGLLYCRKEQLCDALREFLR